MNGSFEVRTVHELLDAEFTAKWRDRATLDPLARKFSEGTRSPTS